jgi:RNA recognition motif-containing protein
MHIFIGNLSFIATEKDLRGLFEQFGPVASVNMKKKSPGHAFVVMPDANQGHKAIEALTGTPFMGRVINLSIRVFKGNGIVPKKGQSNIIQKPPES